MTEDSFNVAWTAAIRRIAYIVPDREEKFIFFPSMKVCSKSVIQGVLKDRVVNWKDGPGEWRQTVAKMTPTSFATAQKFTIVRNPYDRAVSAFFHLIRLKVVPEHYSFSRYCAEYLATLGTDANEHFHPQLDGLRHPDGGFIVDHILRFENIQEDWAKLAQVLGVDEELPRLNKGVPRKPFQEYYTDESKEIVSRLYKEDLEIFGYGFDEQPVPWSRKIKTARSKFADDVSLVIKAFERPAATMTLLQSLEDHGYIGKVDIVIADDSKTPDLDERMPAAWVKNIRYLKLPYDTGLAEGRNVAVRDVHTPYMVLLDDDYIVDRPDVFETMFDTMLRHYKHLDILGAGLREGNDKDPRDRIYANFKTTETDLMIMYGHHHRMMDRVWMCDVVVNFFLARTQVVRDVGWTPELKIGGEHYEFFWRAKKAGARVGSLPKLTIRHERKRPEGYWDMRYGRAVKMTERSLELMGFKTLRVYLNHGAFHVGGGFKVQ